MPAGQVRRSSVRTNAEATPQGLYDPTFEHDACGVGFVADLTGRRSHDIVQKALTVLRNLDHRGASGADPDDGDGAGILTQVPHELYTEVCDFPLPDAGAYATGIGFLPSDAAERTAAVEKINAIVEDEGLTLLGWREVPFEPQYSGPAAREVMPYFGQIFITGRQGTATEGLTGIDLERHAYCVRKRAEHETDVYFPSLSPRTIAYKGMLTTRSSNRSSRTCPTAATPPAWPWSTPGSPPTPSPPGPWPTRSASWRTTARSTRSRATGT